VKLLTSTTPGLTLPKNKRSALAFSLIAGGKTTASDIAKKTGLSRQRIHQLNLQYGNGSLLMAKRKRVSFVCKVCHKTKTVKACDYDRSGIYQGGICSRACYWASRHAELYSTYTCVCGKKFERRTKVADQSILLKGYKRLFHNWACWESYKKKEMANVRAARKCEQKRNYDGRRHEQTTPRYLP
jgi:hypothetical protein